MCPLYLTLPQGHTPGQRDMVWTRKVLHPRLTLDPSSHQATSVLICLTADRQLRVGAEWWVSKLCVLYNMLVSDSCLLSNKRTAVRQLRRRKLSPHGQTRGCSGLHTSQFLQPWWFRGFLCLRPKAKYWQELTCLHFVSTYLSQKRESCFPLTLSRDDWWVKIKPEGKMFTRDVQIVEYFNASLWKVNEKS